MLQDAQNSLNYEIAYDADIKSEEQFNADNNELIVQRTAAREAMD
jgi:hypothetical protein